MAKLVPVIPLSMHCTNLSDARYEVYTRAAKGRTHVLGMTARLYTPAPNSARFARLDESSAEDIEKDEDDDDDDHEEYSECG
jgi:hypothetical protein